MLRPSGHWPQSQEFVNATALVAAIGDGRTFSRGRDLSAWLGLVPRQATTGGKPKLLGITKRGSKYLLKLTIQVAGGAAVAGKDIDRIRHLGPRFAGAGTRQYGCGRIGEQVGADRVGATAR